MPHIPIKLPPSDLVYPAFCGVLRIRADGYREHWMLAWLIGHYFAWAAAYGNAGPAGSALFLDKKEVLAARQ